MIDKLHAVILTLAVACLATAVPLSAHAGDVELTIRLDQPAKPISDHLFGIFFEDINYAADGGLYAELVQNRSFEYSPLDNRGWNPLTAWELVQRDGGKGSVEVEGNAPLHENNPHYAVLEVDGTVGLSNVGFDGIAVKAGEEYNVSLFARQLRGAATPLLVRLENNEGVVLAETTLPAPTKSWNQSSATLAAIGSSDKARLVVLTDGKGSLALDMISLFPEQTFHNRPNGLRADLAQVIADLEPKFVRFPGGCLVHGDGLGNMYRWKDTIGPVHERRTQPNIWSYHQTVGLGYFEYFQFCEDIGAKPLPVVPAAVCCQNSGAKITGRWGEGQEGLPLAQMPDYIQEVLDLIEWANGPADSEWGSKRAAAGHPEPFNLEYLGVGNEDHITPVFEERFRLIYDAVKKAHPEITVIGTVGPNSEGSDYERGWEFADQIQIEMVDEHYYKSPAWFLQNLDFYDKYDRSRSRVYLGEYAAHDQGRRTTLRSALAEAAYMTSLERNADVVQMASYAPLLGKIGRTQWNPDLIYFTNTQIVPTINYHAQRLFSVNAGDQLVPCTVKKPGQEGPQHGGRVFLGTWDTQAEFAKVHIDAGTTTVDNAFNKKGQQPKAQSGQWRLENGLCRQSSSATPAICPVATVPVGSDYTLTLRARKTGGSEGFLIGFGGLDSDNYYWWNLGGWGNTQSAIEKSIGGTMQMACTPIDAKIESDRWYNIRVEVRDKQVRCFLDNKLVQETTDEGFKDLPDVATSVVRDSRTGDVILKVVNLTATPSVVHTNLTGAELTSKEAVKTVLTGNPLATNEVGKSERTLPQSSLINVAPTFDYEAPPHSLTVIRISAAAP